MSVRIVIHHEEPFLVSISSECELETGEILQRIDSPSIETSDFLWWDPITMRVHDGNRQGSIGIHSGTAAQAYVGFHARDDVVDEIDGPAIVLDRAVIVG